MLSANNAVPATMNTEVRTRVRRTSRKPSIQSRHSDATTPLSAAGRSLIVASGIRTARGTASSAISIPERRKDALSSNAALASPKTPSATPPSAGPMMRARLSVREVRAFASCSRSSPTRRGSNACSAGTKNWASVAATKVVRYATHTDDADRTSSRDRRVTACRRLTVTIVTLRSHRSTNTPATEPNTRPGK